MLVVRDVKRPENHQGIVSTFLKSGQKVTSLLFAVLKTRLCKKCEKTFALTFCYRSHDAVC